MADIYKAYDFLNKTLELGLSPEQLFKTERMLKARFAEEKGFSMSPDQVNDWEFFAYLQPRSPKKAKRPAKD